MRQSNPTISAFRYLLTIPANKHVVPAQPRNIPGALPLYLGGSCCADRQDSERDGESMLHRVVDKVHGSAQRF